MIVANTASSVMQRIFSSSMIFFGTVLKVESIEAFSTFPKTHSSMWGIKMKAYSSLTVEYVQYFLSAHEYRDASRTSEKSIEASSSKTKKLPDRKFLDNSGFYKVSTFLIQAFSRNFHVNKVLEGRYWVIVCDCATRVDFFGKRWYFSNIVFIPPIRLLSS